MIFQTNSAPRRRNLNLRPALFSLCALVVLATALRGQEPAPPPPSNAPAGQGPGARSPEAREEQQTERLTKALKLTPDQVTQLKAIQDATRQKLMALRDGSSPRGHRRERMEAIQQDARSQIRALLNDRQKARFDEIMQRQDERREHGPRNGGGFAPPP